MKELKYLFYVLFLALSFTACSDDGDGDGSDDGGKKPGKEENVNKNVVTTDAAVARLEFPRLKGGNSIVVVHRTTGDKRYDKDEVNYAIEWDRNKKSQRWSCYQMHIGYTGSYNRVIKNYPNDPQLSAADYWDQDYYYGSGYQHGHICPNADRKYSYKANEQTFYLSNMQPQYPRFNGYSSNSGDKGEGLWVRMEGVVRGWTPKAKSDTLYVCKGGTIDRESDIIERIAGKLIVPKYFFMACLVKNSSGCRAIAFFAEHKNQWGTNDDLTDYVMSIDDLERRTGIDFFCNLPDKIENDIESHVALSAWGLK